MDAKRLPALYEHLRTLGRAYLILILAITLTAAASYFSRLSYHTAQNERLIRLADEIKDSLRRRAEASINALYGVAGLYRASISVERNEFHAYIEATHLIERYPGVRSIGFARRVAAQDIPAFTDRVRHDTSVQAGGYPSFRVTLLTPRSEYLINDYVEPMSGNREIFGRDMSADEQRAQAIARARDTGEITMTAPLILGDASPALARGVVIMLPIYRNGVSTATLAGRRAAFDGVVFARLEAAALFGELLDTKTAQSLFIKVTDVTDKAYPQPLYHSRGADRRLADGSMFYSRRLNITDRQWELEVRPYANGMPSGVIDLSPYVDIVGLVISLLLFSLAWTQASHNAQRRRQNNALRHQATHDSLTGLPNRHFVYRELGLRLHNSKADNPLLAVLLIDLNGFKDINDTLGHHCGDQLLRMIGPRLRALLAPEDCLARLGGDEFALLISSSRNLVQITRALEEIQSVFGQPFEIEGLKLRIGASIGVALFPEHGGDVTTLMRHADIAMYVAKNAAQGYAIYDAAHDSHSPQRLALLTELGDALRNNQLVLHYQPIIDTHDGAVRSVEALLRWRHPQRGLVQPGDFIAQAERSELIKPITLWVLDTALRQHIAWRDQGIELKVAVNISARNLHDNDLPQLVLDLCKKHAADPEYLTLEITESAIITDPKRALETLQELSRAGITIAIDDFGTGFTSLGYLKNLSARHLKIDRSFVTEMVHDENDAVIVRSIIDLSHNLGMTVVAEGVESRDVHDILEILGCDQLQGYFYAKPMAAEMLTDWLSRHDAHFRLTQHSSLHALR
ncbi:MAG: putative bifunctional diguanylate cyclase/phosphodiesterase [Gammaproteobacteria bacterium]